MVQTDSSWAGQWLSQLQLEIPLARYYYGYNGWPRLPWSASSSNLPAWVAHVQPIMACCGRQTCWPASLLACLQEGVCEWLRTFRTEKPVPAFQLRRAAATGGILHRCTVLVGRILQLYDPYRTPPFLPVLPCRSSTGTSTSWYSCRILLQLYSCTALLLYRILLLATAVARAVGSYYLRVATCTYM